MKMEDIYEIQEENWENFHNKVAYRKKIPLSTFKFKIPRELELLKMIPRSVVPRKYLATPDTLVELSGNIVNQIPLPEVFKWTSVDVMKWLDKIGFPQYRDTFYHNFINGRTLLLVDASALQAMNIKKFAHIKIITDAIRKLYEVELVLFNRSISLPPRYPGTHYKLYRVHTGPKYARTRPTDLWRKMKILRDPPTYENHWTTLEKWLKHIPDYQLERIGYAPRRNLYKVKKAPPEVKIEEHKPPCNCIPPCECKWTKKHLRLPWSLEYLKNLVPIEDEDLCACVISSKETIEGECLCPEECIEEEEEEASKTDGEHYFEPCNCIPPCECGWIDRQLKSQWMLTILKEKNKLAAPVSDGGRNSSESGKQKTDKTIDNFFQKNARSVKFPSKDVVSDISCSSTPIPLNAIQGASFYSQSFTSPVTESVALHLFLQSLHEKENLDMSP